MKAKESARPGGEPIAHRPSPIAKENHAAYRWWREEWGEVGLSRAGAEPATDRDGRDGGSIGVGGRGEQSGDGWRSRDRGAVLDLILGNGGLGNVDATHRNAG